MSTTTPPGATAAELLTIAGEELAAALAIVGDPLAPSECSLIHFERTWLHLVQASGAEPSPAELANWVRNNDLPGLTGKRRHRAADLLANIVDRDAGSGATKPWRAASLRAHGRTLTRILTTMTTELDGWSARRQRRLRWLKWAVIATPLLALLIAYAMLWWDASKPGMWRGAYYPRDDFAGKPFVRRDKIISFNWRHHSPMEALPDDHFSIRWDTCLHINTPVKAAFQLISNNDSRLFVDGDLAVDNWGNDGQRTSGGWYDLSVGTHHLQVEFREGQKQANIWFLATFGDDPPTHIPRSMLSYPGNAVNEDNPCH